MSFRRTSLTFCAVFFTLGVLLAGCGGAPPDDGSQNDSSGGTQNQESSEVGRTSVETRITIGRVADVRAEGRRLIVRSSTGGEDTPRMVFVVTENARITLDGQEATLEEAEKGQQAQVKYVVRKDLGRAREVVLFGQKGSPGNGGTTG